MSWAKKHRYKPVPDAVRCTFVKEDGEQCQAASLKELRDRPEEEGGPRCVQHSKTAEERSDFAREMARRSAIKRRGDASAAPKLSGLDGDITHRELCSILSDALVATDPVTGEPLWGVRLAAVASLVSAYPAHYRKDPEETAALIKRLVPDEMRSSQMEDAREVYKALRREWDEIDSLRWDDVKGLYRKPYPAWCIAPFENAQRIQASQAKPDDSMQIKHFGDSVILSRPGELLREIPREPIEVDDFEDTIALPY